MNIDLNWYVNQFINGQVRRFNVIPNTGYIHPQYIEAICQYVIRQYPRFTYEDFDFLQDLIQCLNPMLSYNNYSYSANISNALRHAMKYCPDNSYQFYPMIRPTTLVGFSKLNFVDPQLMAKVNDSVFQNMTDSQAASLSTLQLKALRYSQLQILLKSPNILASTKKRIYDIISMTGGAILAAVPNISTTGIPAQTGYPASTLASTPTIAQTGYPASTLASTPSIAQTGYPASTLASTSSIAQTGTIAQTGYPAPPPLPTASNPYTQPSVNNDDIYTKSRLLISNLSSARNIKNDSPTDYVPLQIGTRLLSVECFLHFVSRDPSFLPNATECDSLIRENLIGDNQLDLTKMISGNIDLDGSKVNNVYDFAISIGNFIANDPNYANASPQVKANISSAFKAILRESLDFMNDYMNRYGIINDNLIKMNDNLLFLYKTVGGSGDSLSSLNSAYSDIRTAISRNIDTTKEIQNEVLNRTVPGSVENNEANELIAQLRNELTHLNTQHDQLTTKLTTLRSDINSIRNSVTDQNILNLSTKLARV